MFGKKKAELEKELKELERDIDNREDEINRLRERNKELTDERQTRERKHANEVEVLNETIEKKARRIGVLEELVEDESKIQTKLIELHQREVVLDAKEVNAANLAEKIAEAKVEGEKHAEKQYQAGYADGLADGLRKAHEITADDRKQANQIAALAAASHQPDATKQIAAAIAKDVARALPATASRKR